MNSLIYYSIILIYYLKQCQTLKKFVSLMLSMVMIVDLRGSDFTVLADDLSAVGTSLGLQIRIQRNEIFDAMHRI